MSLLRVGILSAVEVFGDFMLKSYATTGIVHNLFLGCLGYIGVVATLIWSLKTGNVMLINGLWDGSSAVIGSIAAYFILGDRLENPYQYLGLLLTCLGIFMLKYKNK